MQTISPDEEVRANRLHDESIFVNTYGGPFSGSGVIQGWRRGRLRDDGEWLAPTDTAVRDYLVPEMRAGGLDCVIAGAGREDGLATWLREFQTSAAVATLATTASDVRTAKEQGKVSIILCAGGVAGSGSGEEIDRILLYHKAGVRVWSLTHSARNLISGGCGEDDGPGLSRFGRRFVEELNRQKIAMDISHISDAGFWDVVALSSAPILATHSNCRAVCEHGRNLTDDMIRALVQGGGIICLNFFPLFVKPANATVDDVVDHVDHISALVGPQFVGLGPDFCAGRWESVLQSWWSRGSSDHNTRKMPLDFPAGVEDTTRLRNMTKALVRRGYSDDEIRGILGENFLRYFESVVGR